MRNLAQSLGIGLGKTHSNEEIQFVFTQAQWNFQSRLLGDISATFVMSL